MFVKSVSAPRGQGQLPPSSPPASGRWPVRHRLLPLPELASLFPTGRWAGSAPRSGCAVAASHVGLSLLGAASGPGTGPPVGIATRRGEHRRARIDLRRSPWCLPRGEWRAAAVSSTASTAWSCAFGVHASPGRHSHDACRDRQRRAGGRGDQRTGPSARRGALSALFDLGGGSGAGTGTLCERRAEVESPSAPPVCPSATASASCAMRRRPIATGG